MKNCEQEEFLMGKQVVILNYIHMLRANSCMREYDIDKLCDIYEESKDEIEELIVWFEIFRGSIGIFSFLDENFSREDAPGYSFIAKILIKYGNTYCRNRFSMRPPWNKIAHKAKSEAGENADNYNREFIKDIFEKYRIYRNNLVNECSLKYDNRIVESLGGGGIDYYNKFEVGFLIGFFIGVREGFLKDDNDNLDAELEELGYSYEERKIILMDDDFLREIHAYLEKIAERRSSFGMVKLKDNERNRILAGVCILDNANVFDVKMLFEVED